MPWHLLFTILAGGIAVVGLSYRGHAYSNGWALNALAARVEWYPYHGVAALGFLAAAWHFGGVPAVLLLALAAFLFAAATVKALGFNAYVITVLSLPLAGVLVLYTYR